MAINNPDPLNLQSDALYSVYRKGIITRHISKNGRFLETISLESVDGATPEVFPGAHINIKHSVKFGARGPHLKIHVPKANARFSEEIDLSQPAVNGKYAVRPQMWVPLIAPIKYPGYDDYEEVLIRKGPSPWWPQSPIRRRLRSKKVYYVATSGRADNPAYYGGMALAAFALESLHGVSPRSIEYARTLVQGFLAMEMNGHNGYVIRYRTWHTAKGEVKEIRGASSEELLGLMLGIMFYLKAEVRESPNHPLINRVIAFRDRVLGRISKEYSHPFMSTSYPVKHFEPAFYGSIGTTRGSEFVFKETLFRGMLNLSFVNDLFGGRLNLSFEGDKRMQNLVMSLYAIILILAGDLSEAKKESWAPILLWFIKFALKQGADIFRKNAFLAVVALLINKYLNPARDCFIKGTNFVDMWTHRQNFYAVAPAMTLGAWDTMISDMEKRIFRCQSLENEIEPQNPAYEDHWQHGLPLYTIEPDSTTDQARQRVWKPHNPHKRLGAFIEWKIPYQQWWQNPMSMFSDYMGWKDELSGLNEQEYLVSLYKRYKSVARSNSDPDGYVEKEVVQFRGHHNNQIEGAGMSLIFLRMMLTHINPLAYPPPQLADKNTLYPLLPFRGVEAMEPKFLHYQYKYRSIDDGWTIKGDKDKALRIIAFPSRNMIFTASAFDDQKLWLDAWRLDNAGFSYINGTEQFRFDQAVVRKTSSSFRDDDQDILVIAERAEEQRTWRGNHFLRLSMHRVNSNGTVTQLASVIGSDQEAGSTQQLDMCILAYQFAIVTFKTRNNKARVKIFLLDFRNNSIVERSVFDAEFGSNEAHREIEDMVWVGSAWNDVVINGYKSKADPYNHFKIFSRKFGYFDKPFTALSPATRKNPATAVTVQRGGKWYVVTASHSKVTQSGYNGSRFSLDSWEVARNGQLTHRGTMDSDWDDQYLFRIVPTFERLSICRASFGKEGEFLITGKTRIGGGKGLLLLYGGVTEEGRPTLWDWNCIGSGDDDAVQMVDVCGDSFLGDKNGAVTAYKDSDNGLHLTWWRYGEDFQLDNKFQSPTRVTPRTSARENTFGHSGND